VVRRGNENLNTVQNICEELLRILETCPDYPVAISTVRLCLACVYDINAATTFERNEENESLMAKKESIEFRLQASILQKQIMRLERYSSAIGRTGDRS
jgi:hypothetical protein